MMVPTLRAASFDDYESIRRLWEEVTWQMPSPTDWQALWINNPVCQRLGKNYSLGWVLEQGNKVVGSLTSFPRPYTFQGADIVCANPLGWVVQADYRGYAPLLFYEYFDQPNIDLFIYATVSAQLHPVFEELARRVPVGNWGLASLWAVSHVGLAQKVLRTLRTPFADVLAYPIGGVLWLKDCLSRPPVPKTPTPYTVDFQDGFDAKFDIFWNDLLKEQPEKLLAERTCAALTWYFAKPLRTNRVWILTACRSEQLRAYSIFGCFEHGRRARLIDYQTLEPEIDLLPNFLGAALRRCATQRVWFLENWGRGVPKMRTADDCAPYRRKLSSWSFYYRAADPTLDAKLASAQYWEPSTFDGDDSLVGP
jgi:hypothetical protein